MRFISKSAKENRIIIVSSKRTLVCVKQQLQRAWAAEPTYTSAMRLNEHRFITFLACSKQVPKDSSPEDEVEEQATPLRVDRHELLLAPRWWP